jgi:acetylornithine deacetylase
MTVDRTYITEVLRELVSVSSVNPPGDEKALAERISGLLQHIGIPSIVDSIDETRANVVGTLAGSGDGPVLVLNGHLDTVPVKEDWEHPPLAGEVVGGRIYGLGAADMKGGIASMIGAVKEIKESGEGIKGTVILAFVADEEIGNAGARHFLSSHVPIDCAIIGEPTNLEIVNSHRGVVRFRITTFGTAGHASNPSQGSNAIYKMNQAISGLKNLADTYGAKDKELWQRPTLAVTQIHGGTGDNVIPDRCEIVVDRRIVYGEERNRVEEEILAPLKELEQRDETLRYTLETTTALDAWRAEDDSRILKHASQAYQECFHRPPTFLDLGATCEAALFGAKGIDTFVFGPGHISKAHTKDEWVEIEQLVKAAEFYTAVIRKVLVD